MKTTTKKLSDTKVELKVTLEAADLTAPRQAAVAELAKVLELPGFRKGNVPVSVAEQKLSPNVIAEKVIDLAVHATLEAAMKEAKVQPIAIENVSITKYVPDDSAEYVANVEILPEIKLGDYKKLKAKMGDVSASDADVQEILDNIVTAYAEKKVVKRAAANGDEVIIDFVGKKDGEAFPGGSAKDHHLTLGSGQFIPGFEDGIIGHSAGDKFELELTFPKDYPEKTLAGAKTIFEVLLKQVNEVVKPKEDEALAQKCGNFKNMDELKADIRKNLEAQNSYRVREKYCDDLVKELVEKSKVAAPEILIQDQLKFIRDDVVRNAASYGMTFEQFLESQKQTAEDWEKSARALAEDRVKASLVLQILAREAEISASEEEVEAKIAELKDVYKKSKEALENLKKPEVRRDLKNRLTIEKTMDYLIEVNGGDVAKKADKTDKAKKTKTTK